MPSYILNALRDKTFYWGLGLLGILILIRWIYWHSLGTSIQFDDDANLKGLAEIHDLDTAKTFIFSGIAGPLGRPLALLTFALQYYAWPANPDLLIEWNIYIHLLNGVLVTTLALNLGRASFNGYLLIVRIAVLTGSLWLLLPILVSSSLLIVQRMTTLSATFILTGLILYTSIRIKAQTTPNQHLLKFSIIVIIFTGLAAFSKENGILFPLYILAAETSIFTSNKYLCSHINWKLWQWVFLFTPFLIIISYLILQVPYSNATILQHGYTATERISSEGYIIWAYLFNTFLPDPSSLGPYHDIVWQLKPNQIPIGLFLFASALVICSISIKYRKKYPLIAFAILWYFMGHLLESTTIPLELYFEHRNYVPLIGPTFSLITILSASPIWQRGFRLFIAIYFVIMAFITYMTTSLWGQPLLAAEVWAKDNPKSVRATVQLAKELEKDYDSNTALRVLDRFNQTYPDISLGTQIQALTLACWLNKNENLSSRIENIAINAPTARYENWAVEQPEHLHASLIKHDCVGVELSTVTTIADLMINNPRYASNKITLHNLFALKGLVALQYGDITNALIFFDTALTHHIGKDLLRVSLLVAQTHNKSEFIDKWSYAAK